MHLLDGVLATVILRVGGRPVLLSEYAARDYALLKKSVAEKAVVEPVRVDGERGLWLEGPPHTLTYFSGSGEFRQRTVKITGNVLLWTHGPVTLRLEGRISKAAGASTRPPNRLRSPFRGRSAGRSAPNTR